MKILFKNWLTLCQVLSSNRLRSRNEGEDSEKAGGGQVNHSRGEGWWEEVNGMLEISFISPSKNFDTVLCCYSIFICSINTCFVIILQSLVLICFALLCTVADLVF